MKRSFQLALVALVLAWIGTGWYHSYKPLPEGISVAAPMRAAESVRFMADFSYVDRSGKRQVDQRIFDRMLDLIDRAERLVVMDFFLFNDFAGDVDGPDMRPLSKEFAEALMAKKRQRPDLPVIVITDPINNLYGGLDVRPLARLRAAGVEVVITNLRPLRDSNPAWSGLWRICCQWFGNSSRGGWLPNPVGDQKITLRSVLRLLNFKANHRKTLVVDSGPGWTGLVTSGNPHDASSAHANIALEFSGAAALDLLETERAVAAFSAPELAWPARPSELIFATDMESGRQPGHLQVLTEAEIRDHVLDAVELTRAGDSVDLAMFYFSHRELVRALIEAHRRGVRLRVLMDPNKGAFGREKSGVPNRPVGAELHAAGIPLRWCNTRGEQCHDKLMLIQRHNGGAELIAGSANYTRRNLDDLNLETNVRLVIESNAPVVGEVIDYFDRRWHNRPGEIYSVDYAEYADEGWFKYWVYRFTEATGISTY
ncbi:MAG: phospholipase D family protein [Wenzhouxiangellaceae bacterium]|nr:phospholipase D family protein [Wenzhouxiangellaceae bacterium]